MAKYDETKFYWLQLKEDFFEEDAIEWLEEQPNGKEYCLFYLKLCLKSLKDNGILIRKVGELLIPYDNKKLADMTNTNFDTVVIAMKLLTEIGLIKVLENGQLYITQVENMIGSQSKSAFKKQQQRIAHKDKLLGVDICPPMCPPDIEIDIEKELDIENRDNIIVAEPQQEQHTDEQIIEHPILTYWNQKNIIVHKPSAKINATIKKALKTFTEEQIKLYIDRYVKMVNDPNYYFDYKWTLEEFLTRKKGIYDFADDGVKWVNYMQDQDKRSFKPKPKNRPISILDIDFGNNEGF